MSNNKIFKKILIGEIPKSIRQEVSDHIRHYSVVLLISNGSSALPNRYSIGQNQVDKIRGHVSTFDIKLVSLIHMRKA